jgi:hypothetical protein
MKQLHIKIILIFLAISCTMQGSDLPKNKATGDLIVLGKLLRINQNVPACGIIHVGSLSEYGDLTILSGKYAGSKIYAIHGCIEITRKNYADIEGGTLKKFVIGDYHKLALSRENVYDVESVQNGDIDPGKEPVYFCRRVDPASKSN